MWWGSQEEPRTCNERLLNQRPTLVVPPDVSTSVKEIWIGNVLLLESFLLKFLPAPEPFRRKDALGWVWGFFYISICRILQRSWTGRGDFRFEISMQLRAGILSWAPASHAEFLEKAFKLLLDFRQRLLNPEIWHPQRLLNSKMAFRFQDLKPLRCNRMLLNFDIQNHINSDQTLSLSML